MKNMDDSIAYPPATDMFAVPRWKAHVATVCAVLIGLLFLVSGGWKVIDPIGASTKMMQMKVPGAVALPFTILLGIGEVWAAVMLFVPRLRQWGGWIISLMLVAFMVYIGWHYNALIGEECSCFPWIKRAIGPMFFVADGIMLVMSALAAWWSQRSSGLRPAALIAATVAVSAAVCYGVAANRDLGLSAPASVTVAGKPYSLHDGKVLVYFYDPMCPHCADAAKKFATHNWGATKRVAVPIGMKDFAAGFLTNTGFPADLTLDSEPLRKVFEFKDPPYAVALEGGRAKALLNRFDEAEPAATLRQLGFIQ
jgi:uncharacterized membrane protein YphA (DoxX/SURF4 family)